MKTVLFLMVLLKKYRQKYRQFFLCPPLLEENDLYRLSCHQRQFARLCFPIKHNPGLFENPSLNFFVMLRQQFQRSNRVMLFSRGAWFVSHDLRHHASWYFLPLGQAFE